MHLNSIKIRGFKSFAEDVELILEPGITTIVGPNGCGKSNVSDAIRWVLGEQSARGLRCASMRDLLFNGGANFAPAQKTEVALRFSNGHPSNGHPDTPTQDTPKLAFASPEIEVCRHLTRGGESRYLINQNPCRLRDISELFMDTGIGVDAYSVMEQSKIDLILNVRPEDRRFLFEEVAGITKSKHRKKTALRKLEQTEQNLARINDVIQELQRETEELKEQAEQARHYNTQQAQLKQLELELAHREYDKLRIDYDQAQADLDEVVTSVAGASETLKAAEERIENSTNRRSELDAAIREGQVALREIESQIEHIERQIVLHKERQLNIQRQRERALQTLESLKAQQTGILVQQRERNQEYQKLEASCKIEGSRLTARQQLLTELAARISRAKDSVQETQDTLQEITMELTERERERLVIEHKLTSSEGNLDRLKENKTALAAELSTASDTRDEVQYAETQLKAALVQIETEKNQVEIDFNENQDALRKIEAEIRGLQNTLGANVSRLKSLQELQSAYEGYYTGVRAIMQAKTHYPDQFQGVCGVVAELLTTDTQYEVAIEVALGSAIQNVITETAEDAQKGIAFLKQHRAGRVTFLPLDILRGRRFNDDKLLNQPGVIGIAEELIDYDFKYEIAMRHLLGNTLVVKDLDSAIALTRQFRPSARLVTLDGEVINTSGAITGGQTSQKQSGLLSRSRELETLEDEIGRLTQSSNKKDAKRKAYAAAIANLQKTRQTLTAQWQDKRVEKASLTKDLEQANLQVTRLEQQLAALEVENRELDTAVTASREEQQALETEIQALTQKSSRTQRWIERMSEQIESENRKHAEVASTCQEMEVFLAGQRQKLEGLASELQTLKETQQRTAKDIAEQQEIINTDEQRKSDLVEQVAAAQREFLHLEGDRAEAESHVDELTEERESLLQEVEVLQKEMRATRRNFEKQNRARHKLEVATTQLEMRIKSVSTRIHDKYEVSIDELPPLMDKEFGVTNPSHPAMDEIDLLDSIEKLKAEISGMGAVNLKAIEIYEERKKRHDLLISQRADVEQSLQSTYQVIQKINQTSKELFLETFEQVQTNFQEVFAELFGGGETELLLTDPSNVLESGIDIIARPPGKRPQSITQLSGGERSLVAIGLLFAVFKIKPSPFCVLDEVDAALDEANILRFTNLIRAYAENTQFVIITHNRRTMEIADVMYGVTMEQAGISKIVSAKFAE
ncbi:chromosome segregation protein SMC [Candidatus Poribacteria bacterium]|nr:MAG: chromosome segregation protein SMC [Candidatus Poribacteria bacterium]